MFLPKEIHKIIQLTEVNNYSQLICRTKLHYDIVPHCIVAHKNLKCGKLLRIILLFSAEFKAVVYYDVG